MARKSNILKYQTLSAGDMSTASLTSEITNIQFLDNIGIQMNFTGVPVGTFEVQVSVDHAQDSAGNVTVAGNWVPLELSSSPVAAGTAGSIYVDITQTSAPYIRVVYTKTSGTGSLDTFITAKTV